MISPRHLQAGVEVVHAIPCRLRLRLPPELLDERSRAGIAKAAAAHPSIRTHRFSLACRSLVIEHDGTPSVAALRRLVETAEPADLGQAAEEQPGSTHPAKWAALGLAGALALGGSPLAAPVVLAAGLPIFRRAVRSLLDERRVSVDVLDSIALSFSIAGGHLLTASVVTAMIEGGEWMRDVTASRSRRALGELIADRNAPVRKMVGGERESVHISELRPGDVIALTPGERIPVDGVVRAGLATVDERFLTGEPLPPRRSEGDRVYAMTVVSEGELEVVAGTDIEHSRAGRIVSFLEQASIGDTRMSDHARRIGDRFVPPTLAVGGAVLAATGNPSRAASVITFDLVTGIRVSAPATMLAALTAAARDGILVKGAAVLEQLAQVDAIVFDKTGTLTAGEPRVVKVHSFGEVEPDELLAIAASADHSFGHPLAVALCAEADAHGIATAHPLERSYEVGFGVEARLDGRGSYLVGNRLLLERHGVRPAPLPGYLEEFADASQVWIAQPPDCLGLVLMRDVQRAEARQAVSDLRARGVRRLVLLSGDRDSPARRIAETLGFDEWRARVTPEGKADAVRCLKEEGLRVAVVGDGINDSLALTAADVAVAMGKGSDIASSTAQVVLIDDDLTLLVRSLDRAREAVRLMRQNLWLIGIPNLFGLIAALLVPMSPAVAGVLSNGSTIIAASNGLRPLHQPPAGR